VTAKTWLLDLYRHQTWADAEHWRMFGASSKARDDRAIRTRLHHIHFVQHAFLWTVGDRRTPFAVTKPDDFASLDSLQDYARAFHAQVEPLLESVTDERLATSIDIVWFKDPPLAIPVSEALLQCAMHSHYHRGQNAARFRELGGEPVTTDYIVWLWKGRPAPAW
jgi:uncharacterized damage-inducible protein DinB